MKLNLMSMQELDKIVRDPQKDPTIRRACLKELHQREDRRHRHDYITTYYTPGL